MNRLVILPEADVDVDRIARFISRSSLDAGRRFYGAAREAFQKLLDRPDAGTIVRSKKSKLRRIRIFAIPDFRNPIMYREIPGGIEVLRVIHGARNWRSKLDG